MSCMMLICAVLSVTPESYRDAYERSEKQKIPLVVILTAEPGTLCLPCEILKKGLPAAKLNAAVTIIHRGDPMFDAFVEITRKTLPPTKPGEQDRSGLVPQIHVMRSARNAVRIGIKAKTAADAAVELEALVP